MVSLVGPLVLLARLRLVAGASLAARPPIVGPYQARNLLLVPITFGA